MTILHDRLAKQFPEIKKELRDIGKKHGDEVISEVTVRQAYMGMRGVVALVCDTSLVDPQKGLIIRGKPLLEGPSERLPEEIFFLLLTGELPDEDERAELQDIYREREGVPSYVWDILRDMPDDAHPMSMLDTGILAMERESVFRKKYDEGINREDYWKPVLEDSLTLLARLPELAAGVYRIRYNKGDLIPPKADLDWGANFAHMLGIDKEDFYDCMRLYLTLHCDHEGGNVSAFSCHTVASALSDPYYSVSAGLNGLAGPLHGLANQECLKWILQLREDLGGTPTKEEIEEYTWDTLNAGDVIPGYGHAVLRATDPRFIAFNEFAKEHLPDDPIFKTVNRVYEVVPDVLKEQGKASNPYPNVDAHSGCLLYHYGIEEFEFYTVFFSVSRAMGMCAQQIINRGIETPITRPKSVGTDWIKDHVGYEG